MFFGRKRKPVQPTIITRIEYVQPDPKTHLNKELIWETLRDQYAKVAVRSDEVWREREQYEMHSRPWWSAQERLQHLSGQQDGIVDAAVTLCNEYRAVVTFQFGKYAHELALASKAS